MEQTIQNNIWSFEPFFSSPTDNRIEIALENSKTRIDIFVDKWSNRTDYLTDEKLLKQSLDDYNNLQKQGGLTNYAYEYLELLFEANQTNTDINSRFKQLQQINAERENRIVFYTLSLGSIPTEKLQHFISSPLLEEYKHYLETILAEKLHQLSEKEEQLLSLLQPLTYSNWISLLDSQLNTSTAIVHIPSQDDTITTQTQSVEFNELLGYLSSSDETLVDQAGNAVSGILEQYKSIAEKELNSILEYRYKTDTLRGFSRPDLATHLRDDIETDVIDALIHAVTEHFDISHRYYALKARVLNKEKISYHQRLIPVGVFDKQYNWEQTKAITLQTLENLDPEFKRIIQDMIDQGRVDVYPRSGKSGGAFCMPGRNQFPNFILLNQTDDVHSVETFAHESGHALHFHYSNKHQNRLNTSMSLFTAEVASISVESYAIDTLLTDSTLTAKEKQSLQFTELEGTISSVFRQVALYNFETELHACYRQKGYLSLDSINELFAKHMSSYLGDVVTINPEHSLWWIYWGHIRLYFYTYSYASGLLIAKTIKHNIDKDHSFIESFKQFMKAGSSLSGKDIFASIGIDVANPEFWYTGLASIDKQLEVLNTSITQ